MGEYVKAYYLELTEKLKVTEVDIQASGIALGYKAPLPYFVKEMNALIGETAFTKPCKKFDGSMSMFAKSEEDIEKAFVKMTSLKSLSQ